MAFQSQYTYACMIVPASIQAAIKNSAALASSECGGLFTTALSPSGNLPATHYISSGLIPSDFLNAMMGAQRLYNFVSAACAALRNPIGMPYTLPQIQGALIQMDISIDDAQTAMARLGLQIANPVHA